MADTRCYKNSTRNGKSTIKDVSDYDSVCPGTTQSDGFSRCCGKSGICLPNGICQALNKPAGGTGFYIGSCTDRNYDSPACSNFCSGITLPDIVYNSSEEKWQCCGSDAKGKINCDDPLKRFSKAPAPTALLDQYSVSASEFTATASSSSTSTSSTPPTPTTTPQENSGELSTGEKVGAGIGGALGGLAIIALIIFLLKWRRVKLTTQSPHGKQGEHMRRYDDMVKQNTYSSSPRHPLTEQHSKPAYVGPIELSAHDSASSSHELIGVSRPTAQPPQELPS